MAYDWPHFVGYRFGLFYYSTKECGGYVDYDYFHIEDEPDYNYITKPVKPDPTETPVASHPPVTPKAPSTVSPDVTASTTPDNTQNVSEQEVKSKKIKVSVSGYSLQKNKLYLKKGKSVALKATLIPKNVSQQGVTYKSNNKKVAVVSANGVVKVKKAGVAKITICAKDGSAKTTIYVNGTKKSKKNKKLSLASKNLTLGRNQTADIAIRKITAGTTSKLTYRSNNKKVATVDSYGTIYPRKSGTAMISVKCDSKKEKIKVIVK